MRVAVSVIVIGVCLGVFIGVAWPAREVDKADGSHARHEAESEVNGHVPPAPLAAPPTQGERMRVATSPRGVGAGASNAENVSEHGDGSAVGMWHASTGSGDDDILDICDDPAVRSSVRNMRGEDHVEGNFENAQLACADLREAVLVGANFWKADLRGADLTDARLHRAKLRHSDFRNAVLVNADMSNTGLVSVDLRAADLRGASFRCSDCREYMVHAFFWWSDLRGADFRGVDFGWSSLRSAKLQGADLRGANLADVFDFRQISAVDVEGFSTGGEPLQGALYDEATKFPAGVDPSSFGMVFERDPEGGGDDRL